MPNGIQFQITIRSKKQNIRICQLSTESNNFYPIHFLVLSLWWFPTSSLLGCCRMMPFQVPCHEKSCLEMNQNKHHVRPIVVINIKNGMNCQANISQMNLHFLAVYILRGWDGVHMIDVFYSILQFILRNIFLYADFLLYKHVYTHL